MPVKCCHWLAARSRRKVCSPSNYGIYAAVSPFRVLTNCDGLLSNCPRIHRNVGPTGGSSSGILYNAVPKLFPLLLRKGISYISLNPAQQKERLSPDIHPLMLGEVEFCGPSGGRIALFRTDTYHTGYIFHTGLCHDRKHRSKSAHILPG